MATNLNLDDEVAAASSVTQSATGWADRIVTLITAAFKSDRNPFGSAATVDTGTTAGDVPVLGTGGRLDSDRLPAASMAVAGAVKLANSTEFAQRNATTALTPSHLNSLNATESSAGLVRRATASEVTGRTNVNAFCSPSEVATIAGAASAAASLAGYTVVPQVTELINANADVTQRLRWVQVAGNSIDSAAYSYLVFDAEVIDVRHIEWMPMFSWLATPVGSSGAAVGDGAIQLSGLNSEGDELYIGRTLANHVLFSSTVANEDAMPLKVFGINFALQAPQE